MKIIDHLEELEKKGTAGTWEYWEDPPGLCSAIKCGIKPIIYESQGDIMNDLKFDDMRFIAALRNAAPALIAVAKAADKYTGNLGMQHYWRCSLNNVPKGSGIESACNCGGQELWDALAALEALK